MPTGSTARGAPCDAGVVAAAALLMRSWCSFLVTARHTVVTRANRLNFVLERNGGFAESPGGVELAPDRFMIAAVWDVSWSLALRPTGRDARPSAT